MLVLELLQESSQQNSIDPLLNQIKELFFSYFDHPWLINIINELPENRSYIGSIRTFLTLSSIHPLKESIVLNGITSLKTLIRNVNIWLIPETADIFGISPFAKKTVLSNLKLRKCIAYTLPVNTRNLETLIDELEKEILRESLILG